jgi:predicted GTPase
VIKEQLAESDIIMLIKDGSNKELSTSLRLMQLVPKNRQVILAINKSDHIGNCSGWNKEKCIPTVELEQYLSNDIKHTLKTLNESNPPSKISSAIYYSAFCNYNIDALVAMVIENIPFYKANG